MLEVNIIGKYVEFKYCECGCQKTLSKYDIENGYVRKNRPRRFINGHQNRPQEIRDKISKANLGEKNPSYTGGSHVTEGYRRILMRGHRLADTKGYVREHRYLFEQYHQCCLLPWAHIHHKNGDGLDNRKENLQGMTKHHHMILPKKDMSNRFCLLCGSKTTYKNKKNVYVWMKQKDGHLCKSCYDKQYHRSRS